MSIKRYDLWSSGFAPENGEMIQADNGEYMLFDDHKAIYKTGCDMIAELEATIATLTAENENLKKDIAYRSDVALQIQRNNEALRLHVATLTAERDQLRKELAEAKAVVEKLRDEARNAGGQLVAMLDLSENGKRPLKLSEKQVAMMVKRAESIQAALAWAEAKKGDGT